MVDRICIAICAYNEASNIGKVLSHTSHAYNFVVVDDGSSDNTSAVARGYGVEVIRHAVNLGQGVAINTAFRYALEKGYDYVVTMDADGQHDPSEIHILISALKREKVDCVTGSRILGGVSYTMAPMRRLFLPLYTGLINFISGYRLTDSMCGFRGYRVEFLRENAYLLDALIEPQYFSAEMLIKFAKGGMTIAEVPITIHSRQSGESYKGMFKYGVSVAWSILHSLSGRNK